MRKIKTAKVLPFRERPSLSSEHLPTTALFQIGSTRFAIHMWWERLPPALGLEPRGMKEPNPALLRKADTAAPSFASRGAEHMHDGRSRNVRPLSGNVIQRNPESG
jgi:hypothetical protein